MTAGTRGGSVRRIFENIGLLAGGKIGAGLLSLAYVVIVARSLGATQYGILILLHGYTVFIGSSIAFSGFHGVVRYGNVALQEGDHGRLMRLIRFMTLVEVLFGIFAILIAIALIPIVGPRFGWSSAVMSLAVPYSLAILASTRATPYGILQIAGRFDLLSAHQLINPIIRLSGCLLTLLLGGGLLTFLTIWLLASIAEGLGMWLLGLWVLRRMRLAEPIIGPVPVRKVRAENEGLLSFIVTTNVDITLSELGPKLAPLTVGWILGPTAAGLFSLAQRASIVLQQPAQMLGQSSYAVVAKLLAQRDYRGFRQAVWHSALLATAIGLPFTIALGVFANPVLHFFGGKSFTGAAWMLSLTATARLLALGTSSFSPGLIALGLPNRSIRAKLLGNLLLYPLLPPFLWWLGLNGAGWHALLQSAVIALSLIWSFRQAAREHTRGPDPNPEPLAD